MNAMLPSILIQRPLKKSMNPLLPIQFLVKIQIKKLAHILLILLLYSLVYPL